MAELKDLYIDDQQLVDYIIEVKSGTNWKSLKYKSGIIITYGTVNLSS